MLIYLHQSNGKETSMDTDKVKTEASNKKKDLYGFVCWSW